MVQHNNSTTIVHDRDSVWSYETAEATSIITMKRKWNHRNMSNPHQDSHWQNWIISKNTFGFANNGMSHSIQCYFNATSRENKLSSGSSIGTGTSTTQKLPCYHPPVMTWGYKNKTNQKPNRMAKRKTRISIRPISTTNVSDEQIRAVFHQNHPIRQQE